MKLFSLKSLLFTLLFASPSLSSLALPLSDIEVDLEFRHFISRHNKRYRHDEVFHRFNIFKENLHKIYKHNEHYHAHHEPYRPTYKLAVNEFADMTHEEFKQHVGIKKGYKPIHLNYLRNLNSPHDLYSVRPAKEIDWVKKGAVTKVKDQGQCGSCYAFSATGALEGAHFLATGELISLSEQELIDCSAAQGNEGCNGGLMDQAFEFVIANGGVCAESNYTYTAVQSTRCLARQCDPIAKITGYKDIESGNENQLLLALNKQPISVAIEADEPAFQFYSEGVMNGECGAQLDHGVLLVAYGNEVINGTSIDYWTIKNSWSSKWGENGYIRIERGRNLCGIANAASYPVVEMNPTPELIML